MPKGQPLRLDDFLPFRLSVASNMVSDAIATAYQRLFALKIPEWRLVAVIAEHDGISQQAIGRITRMDKVTVSRAAIALIDRGFVTRAINPADGRSQLLSLSDSGRALYREVAPKALELERAIFGGFDAADIAHLRNMLDAIEEKALSLQSEI